MNNRYNRLLKTDKEKSEFWPSFTDMLTTILLVVLLVCVVSTTQIYEQLKVQKEKLEELGAENEERQEMLDGYENVIKTQQKEIEEKTDIIDDFIGIKYDIIDDLEVTFAEQNIGVNIEAETGDISFDSNILFDYDSSDLKEAAKVELKKFIPIYVGVLAQYKDHIDEIIVEGHTDNEGSYLYNLKLSQDRAFSVMYYILSEEFGNFMGKDYLEQITTANGRSYSEPITKEIDGKRIINNEESRRVVFQFRLKGAEYVAKQLNSSIEVVP